MSNFPDLATYARIANEVASLLQIKNVAYGNAFDKTTAILELLYPNGIPKECFRDVHVIVRVLDKLSRIAQNNDPLGESPWQDITGYSILAQTAQLKDKHDEKQRIAKSCIDASNRYYEETKATLKVETKDGK
jgi:hypothetical protein